MSICAEPSPNRPTSHCDFRNELRWRGADEYTNEWEEDGYALYGLCVRMDVWDASMWIDLGYLGMLVCLCACAWM